MDMQGLQQLHHILIILNMQMVLLEQMYLLQILEYLGLQQMMEIVLQNLKELLTFGMLIYKMEVNLN